MRKSLYPCNRRSYYSDEAATLWSTSLTQSIHQPSEKMSCLTDLEQLAKIASSIAIPIIVAVIGTSIQRGISENTLHKDYVSLALSILSKPKSETDTNLRAWAVQLLNYHSPVQLNPTTTEELTSGTVTLPSVNPSSHTNRNTPVENRNGEILALESPNENGRCLIQITYGENCRAEYKWRYKMNSHSEEKGSGLLFEKHNVVDGKNIPVGNTVFHAGPFKVEWSCRNNDSGWIYTVPPIRITSMGAGSIDDYPL